MTALALSTPRHSAQVDQVPESLAVLIVDDDELYLQLAQRLLGRDKKYNYKCSTADNGALAIELCKTIDFDIILIDYHLPEMSGLECLEAINFVYSANDYIPPAILSTSAGSEKIAGDALRADVDDYIPKENINQSSLARAIDHAVIKSRLQHSNVLQMRELAEMNIQLEKKNRETSRFYQTISHEVKTPLASAREFISLVRDGVTGEINQQQSELLDYALSGCDQLARHFDDLVDITRLDLKKLPLKKSEFEITALLKRSIASCQQVVRENSGTVSLVNHSKSNQTLHADEDRIIQVLSNLIGNAIKYSEGKPEVSIHVSQDNDNIKFRVRDRGCGISDKDKTKVFEKLYQSQAATHECLGAGIGLGLSIAKEIIELHDGSIWVESEIGKGSDFYFTLPLPDSE